MMEATENLQLRMLPLRPEEPIELVSDICEFAVGKCFGNSENRICVDKTFCPAKVFKVPSLS